MRFTKYEVISFFTTALTFGLLFAYLLGWPNISSSMGGGMDAPASKSAKNVPFAKAIDNFNGVNIYYNGKVGNVAGRNVTKDGYNLGLKYQCVEFVKRYYYEYYNHKMPDSYGHAKDFYDRHVADGQMNKSRALRQFTNGSIARPKVGDIVVFGPTPYNRFGHIGIVSKSGRESIEMVHQNPGEGAPSRVRYGLKKTNGLWYIEEAYTLGWLRRS